jgi:hypothetical protein
VTSIVSRALSKRADERFATAAEMQQALERAMVEVGASTTATAVAEFLREHGGDRAQKRKESIALGLNAADEREKVAAIMKSNADASGPTSSPSPSPGPRPLTPITLAGEKTSSGTLGLATITLSLPIRPRRVSFVLLGAAVGLGIGIAGMLLVRSGSSKPVIPAPAAPPPPAVSTVVPPPGPTQEPSAAPAASQPPAAPPASTPASPSPFPRPRFVPRARPKERVSDGF